MKPAKKVCRRGKNVGKHCENSGERNHAKMWEGGRERGREGGSSSVTEWKREKEKGELQERISKAV